MSKLDDIITNLVFQVINLDDKDHSSHIEEDAKQQLKLMIIESYVDCLHEGKTPAEASLLFLDKVSKL